MKICAVASTFGIAVIPHVWGSGVGLAAGMRLTYGIAVIPHELGSGVRQEVDLLDSGHSQ